MAHQSQLVVPDRKGGFWYPQEMAPPGVFVEASERKCPPLGETEFLRYVVPAWTSPNGWTKVGLEAGRSYGNVSVRMDHRWGYDVLDLNLWRFRPSPGARQWAVEYARPGHRTYRRRAFWVA